MLRGHGFWPLLAAQSLGALNDNLFKTGVTVLIAYGLWQAGDIKPEMLVSIAAALFTLPFLLFAPLGGQLIQRFDEGLVIRAIKMAEIAIVILAGIALWLHNILLAFVVLFLLGTHSAMLNPAKFSALKRLMPDDKLLAGNGVMNTGTFLAILAGNIGAGLLAPQPGGAFMLAGVMAVMALLGFWFALRLPALLPAPPHLWPVRWMVSPLRGAAEMLRILLQQIWPVLFSIIGCAWFYFVGATLLMQLPNWTRQILKADADVFTLFMVIFSCGIAAGSVLAGFLGKGRFMRRVVGMGLLGCGIGIIDFAAASQRLAPPDADFLHDAGSFLAAHGSWHVMLALFLLSLFAGLFYIPLKTAIQSETADDARPKVLAASAYTDAAFIFMAAIAAAGLLGAGFGLTDIVFALGTLTMLLALPVNRIMAL